MSHRDQAAVDVGIILLFIRTVRTKNRKGDICIGGDIRLLELKPRAKATAILVRIPPG